MTIIIPTNLPPNVTIYTDGACSGNPGPGGWAAILICGEDGKRISGYEENTTNNRMELLAAIKGLAELNCSCNVELISDSQYLVNTINKGWKRNKNLDLWEQLDYYNSIHTVTYTWVKGHASNKYNAECDKLAVAEYKKINKS
jgi:ribonuclease HI